MKSNRVITAALILLFAALSCNMPGGQPPLSVDDQAATIIAATLQAGTENGADIPITANPSRTPASTSTVNTNAPSASAAPSRTITPTFSTPMLTVIEQTNCREGPGQDYEVVFTYLPNAHLVILGRYETENYWLVKSDESSTGSCWLWGEYVEVSGSYWVVPSVTPPPTATQSLPAAPTFQNWDYTCTFNGTNTDLNVLLEWSDRSNNETGFRVFRDGGLLVELPAGSISHADTTDVNPGENTTYRVEAYNITGSASTSTISIACP